MNMQTQTETNESQRMSQGSYSNNTYRYNYPKASQVMVTQDAIQLDKAKELKLAIAGLHIGQRIHEELKQQGRTVTWLAKQLCMERTSLYYTFRQNSINLELLLRISFFLNHNFLQDIMDLFNHPSDSETR